MMDAQTWTRRIVAVFVLLVLAATIPLGARAQGSASRFFSETGYGVAEGPILDYFEARGGVDTFGYPVSDAFTLRGLPVQIFQRHVLQVVGDAARPVNLLDPEIMPLTRLNGSTFPAYDETVAAAAPAPETTNYGVAVNDHIVATVPNEWEGVQVGFRDYYFDAAPTGTSGDEALLALEVWGFPTSTPQRDPTNSNFVYQRFQRGIMHHDATTGITRGILLGDAFKSLVTGRNVPLDLATELAASPFRDLYDPLSPNSLAREETEIAPPITRANSDLTGAFNDIAPPPTTPSVDTVDIYLIALDNGGPVGCGDTAQVVTRTVTPTTMPLTAALTELLSIEDQFLGQSGLYNALYRSDLHIESIDLGSNTTIRLVGEFQIGGVCDAPRVAAQLYQTVLLFPTIERATIYINGQELDPVNGQLGTP